MNIIISAVLGTVVLAILSIIFGLLISGVDRKISARMQARVGPRIIQPFIDVMKLFAKQSIVPENAVKWLFNLMPIAALASAVAILLYLPFGSIAPILGGSGDIILILYLLLMPSLAMVIGGFASGSPYASIGAQREMVSMIAFELPLAFAAILIVWRLMVSGVTDPFAMTTLMEVSVWDAAGPLGIAGCIILLFLFAWITPGEISKVPFDTPEAETELAGGILSEYSGRNLGMFTLSQAVKTIAISAFGVAVLLPWNLSPVLGLSGVAAAAVDLLFFAAKLLVVLVLSVTLIRTMTARLRITQVVKLNWFIFGLLSAAAMILFIADAAVMGVI